MIIEVDFSHAKLPTEEQLQRLRNEFMSTVRRWANLYLREPRRTAFLQEAEREWREAERDIKAFIEVGRESDAKAIVEELLSKKAELITSLSKKAAMHPEIREYLPPLKKPPRAPTAAPMKIPPEVMKFARWLAKLERMTFTPTARLMPRPSVVHPNPLISQFPPMGEKTDNEVIMHSATVGGVMRLAEETKVLIKPKTRWRVDELRRVLEEIYRRSDRYGREWIDLLRRVLGI